MMDVRGGVLAENAFMPLRMVKCKISAPEVPITVGPRRPPSMIVVRVFALEHHAHHQGGCFRYRHRVLQIVSPASALPRHPLSSSNLRALMTFATAFPERKRCPGE